MVAESVSSESLLSCFLVTLRPLATFTFFSTALPPFPLVSTAFLDLGLLFCCFWAILMVKKNKLTHDTCLYIFEITDVKICHLVMV